MAGVQEVAALPKTTAALIKEGAALLGLVFGVHGVVALELVRAMGELAFLLVGAEALLHELAAEFRFFFIVVATFWGVIGRMRLFSGE